MGRRVGGARGGRVLPGLAGGLVRVYAELDRKFCRRATAGECLWCSQLVELRAGRAVVVDGTVMFRGAYDDRDPGRAEEFHDHRAAYVVTGDRWEFLPDE